ncbi:MAG: hypothetical protein B6D37_11660 [Sphingobacteriales bacterium UTBCD1]|jgi:thiol-disulfide isomerase/thioredoxin|nr:MAG: hypothetical protein B6D37_11660 [Sphingobacteriales bacterium UTBCD1]
MRNIILICCCLIYSNVFSQGIHFDSTFTSWDEVLKKAEKLNRPVFVDVYTDWCGPCKVMDKEIFSKDSAGSFYNKHYLSVKINAEKGMGISFAKSYRVNAFPAFFFFSPGGEILLAGLGFMPVATMLQIGATALDNWKNGISLRDMQDKISSGKYDADYLIKYIKKLSSLRSPNALIIEQYLNIIPEDSFYTLQTLKLVSEGYIGRMSTKSIAFKILLHAFKQYPIKSFELKSPWNTIRDHLLEYIDSAGRQKDTLWLQDILAANTELDTVEAVSKIENLYFLCLYYSSAGDTLNTLIRSADFANRYILNMNADSLYEQDLKDFKKALWIRFGTADTTGLQKENSYSVFLKSYFSHTFILVNELQELIFRCSGFANGEEDRARYRNWLNKAIELYKNNPVSVNNFWIKRMQNKLAELSR